MQGSAQAALIAGIARLKASGIDEAASDARLLMAHALAVPAARLSMVIRDPLPKDAAAIFEDAISARARHRPVAQILGERLFWGQRFKVTSDTLDPRPETEILVAAALRQPANILLDLGTGTGCILLSLLAEMPEARGLGLDSSQAALGVAQSNAESLGLADRSDFQLRDWNAQGWAADLGRFDLIVSNPPYIAESEMAGLSADVRDWEPYQALSPGGDGLSPYRAIAAAAPKLLLPQGRVLFEIGPTQAQAVSSYLAAAGLRDIAVLQDFDGRDRVVMARAV